MSARVNVRRMIAVLRSVHWNPTLSLAQRANVLCISRAAIVRLLRAAKEHFGVQTEWSPWTGHLIVDWGMLNRERVIVQRTAERTAEQAAA